MATKGKPGKVGRAPGPEEVYWTMMAQAACSLLTETAAFLAGKDAESDYVAHGRNCAAAAKALFVELAED
jgi:hypothetical protein